MRIAKMTICHLKQITHLSNLSINIANFSEVFVWVTWIQILHSWFSCKQTCFLKLQAILKQYSISVHSEDVKKMNKSEAF